MPSLFDQIAVDMTTGTLTYPKLPGFTLDMEHVYRSAARFAAHCPTTELAVRHAVHEQLSAHHGMMSLPWGL